MPKSVIFTVPLSARRMLPGLMSRCAMPTACAAAMASATCAPISAASAGGSVPRSSSTAERLLDGRNSITRIGSPLSSATSNRAMALRCCRRAAIRASRIARLRTSSVIASDSP